MSASDQRFAGKTAIVTAASRGIGLAIARRLVDNGARVVITARNQDALGAAALELGADRAIAVVGKADDEQHQDATIATAIEEFGGVDLLVNNAGVNPIYGPLADLDLGAARKVVEVNDLAAISWTRKVVAASMGDRGGAVVNISSVAALTPPAGIGFYGASKAMLLHLTRQFALELAPKVRVNAVAPAVVKTRFAAALYEGREQSVAARYPLGRLGEVADVAGPVSFLLSDDAAWITGQVIVIDGGATLTGGVE
ncbi:MAG: 3-ketoacyl-ACP reductase [Actinobacteria bacterium 69-20]|nr:SDR family oxidoreductase [Actinomycetota bacterium]OJV29549.1 MAG: 3-ketoacyl-ACP reductase [Actinobacteria bacterium 69-20]